MVIPGSIFRNRIDVVKFVAYDTRSEWFAGMVASDTDENSMHTTS